MIGGTGRTSRRWVALILAWGATVVVLAGWTPASAHAATLAVDLTINSVVLSGSTPTDRLTLKGRVTNTGDVPAYGVHVVLWRSRDPIKDLPTLAQASANHAGGWGSLMWAKPEHWVSVTDSTT
ncbi:MAG: hypothetical protein WAL91_02230, partial [Propionicimonas sp.]